MALLGTRLGAALQVRRLGIHQAVDSVLGLAQGAHVLEPQNRSESADAREQLRDRVEILEIEHRAPFSIGLFYGDAVAAQHPRQPRRDAFVADDELEMVAAHSRGERAARQKGGAHFDQTIALMHRLGRHRAQPLR